MDARQFHPEPADPSMLEFQPRHRCTYIWDDPNFNAKLSGSRYDGKMYTDEPREPRMITYLRVAGFYGVAYLGRRINIDHSLIAALVERWPPEVHAFHFPFGEVGITLQAVEVLFGLKVDGLAVTGKDKRPPNEWIEECDRLLGFRPTLEVVTTSKIFATALPAVPDLNEWHTDEEVEQATRRLVLHLLGGFLFPDTTKNKVKLFF
ncbi:PREDICTED: serine/threonine-protein phosphatase 7 long form homolog [Ipomoea nil]|uniref:serine/threonine-protein phosphatase 7 long form homolog n=1 Tax=Ipomoea nil TaxID=35883 RepID=UPI000900E142|nr:PREDICTED: serine/threonine-protein phosphatase 7 long form homolog [Ipomoea nil]